MSEKKIDKKALPKVSASDADVRVGDLREGTGRFHVAVLVLEVEDDVALVRLVRSGKEKSMSLRTLRTAYRLLGRDAAQSPAEKGAPST